MYKNSQAAGIVRYQDRRPVKVIAVSSGKGGVGKTNIATNVAIALAQQTRNVMLLDADMSLANVDVLLGLQPRFNLSHVVSGDVDLASTIVDGPHGIRVVPASSGNFAMTNLLQSAHATIINAFSDLTDQPDTLIVDTASGISDDVARYLQAAQEAVIVVCDEPSSITDAYALIKVFSRYHGISHFHIVTNQTPSRHAGQQLFSKIGRVTDLYLDVVLRHLGNVPNDNYLRRSVQEQRAVVDAYPKSPAAVALKDIARKLDLLPIPRNATGGLQFFLESLLESGMHAKGETHERLQ